jgi:hypothetical protein
MEGDENQKNINGGEIKKSSHPLGAHSESACRRVRPGGAASGIAIREEREDLMRLQLLFFEKKM